MTGYTREARSHVSPKFGSLGSGYSGRSDYDTYPSL